MSEYVQDGGRLSAEGQRLLSEAEPMNEELSKARNRVAAGHPSAGK